MMALQLTPDDLTTLRSWDFAIERRVVQKDEEPHDGMAPPVECLRDIYDHLRVMGADPDEAMVFVFQMIHSTLDGFSRMHGCDYLYIN